MKWIGMLLVVAVSSAGGYLLSARMRARAFELEGYVNFIDHAADCIRYTQAPVSAILAEASQMNIFEVLPLVHDCAESIETDRDFAHIWQQALSRSKGALNRTDLAALTPLGEVLGSSDTQIQHAALMRIRAGVEQRMRQAQEESRKYASLYTRLGVLLGVAVAVILL